MTADLKLETRKGLPEHLRVLAEKYPAPTWAAHPNFNDLTSFWLERHLMFRQLLDKMIADAEVALDGAPGPRFGAELSRYGGFFLNQLHHHHMIEDDHYFPQFTALDARLERGFEILDADHHALDAHIRDFGQHTNAVLAALQAPGDKRTALGRLHEVQEDFRKFLHRHLTDEEEIIVPLILEYGPDMQ
ncbi:hemerythrin domain-containing protein [Poseidonocella sedimentorum]|uniref:Iron-sulfur cluster repair protein YtfE, RIC family, contains ScdAN and hemerythrin domains n=1 Tax=Poseidonocella sedimentorum TaxID=871652 RepID=A0A1I6CSQ1_9RHOB|nr:hemerythrin domain-containing protein [Poseidonocella sedimentorum]SFQ96265.1 Iron-sulfur cluster repair protein YtfE, RIC family, contains ScdAN and hemerythrin domains [Poseidonocella sedimentorum]